VAIVSETRCPKISLSKHIELIGFLIKTYGTDGLRLFPGIQAIVSVAILIGTSNQQQTCPLLKNVNVAGTTVYLS